MTTSPLPRSSETILTILDAGTEMSHKDLVKKTQLSPRTVRYGINKLKERHLVVEKLNMRDLRQIIYLNRVPSLQGTGMRTTEREDCKA
ncbi:MAG: MarR family transcriptional regulator [Methanoregula sp.]|jgi:predicted ArsR family transcriptional regulator|uniref:MarR family transcriptional regulator n=1 Tax=Methanoregula sp. TaxID=2052170 RepID=UPI003C1E545C